MPLNAKTGQAIVTPYRKTIIRYDVTEPTVSEPPFAMSRSGDEIAKAVKESAGQSSQVHLLATGAWIIEPYQENLAQVHERTDNQNAVLGKSAWNLIPPPPTPPDPPLLSTYTEAPRWRKPTDLTGALTGADPKLSATGDNFMRRAPAAGESWAQTLTHPLGHPTFPTENIKVDRHAISKANQPEDQAIYLRFEIPGTKQHSPDTVFGYVFGGPATPNGNGQYYIRFNGFGFAWLYEVQAGAWKYRDAFRFCEPHRVCDATHHVRIFPHRSASGSGGYIEFRSSVVEHAPASGGLVSSYVRGTSDPLKHIYPVLYKLPTGGGSPRAFVTGQGPIMVDVRRDHRPSWQVSLLRYPATGSLIDQAFVVPVYVTKRANIVLSWRQYSPTGCSVDGKLFDVSTDTELTVVSTGTNTKTYTPNYKGSGYYAKFTLTADTNGISTPILYGYEVNRDGYVITPSGISEFQGGVIEDVSITGPENDMTHETASVKVDDVQNALPILRARASIRSRIQTQYDSLDTSKVSVLMDGLIQRVNAQRKGLAGSTYPASKRSTLDETWLGMWTRLHRTLAFVRKSWTEDPAVTTAKVPYKVTDIARTMLTWTGLTPAQIDVPDNPMRAWPNPGDDGSSLLVQPLANVIEYVSKLLKDYLGWYLIWDGNVGVTGTPNTTGMIRARPPSLPATAGGTNYTYLAKFLTAQPAGKLVTAPESYPNTATYDTGAKANWTGSSAAIIQAFIEKGSMQSWVKPPEANFVWVSSTGQILPDKSGRYALSNWAANPLSFDFFADAGGATIHTADPTHQDYLGEFVPLIIVDPGMSGDSADNKQRAVDWLTRRYYDQTCHGLKMLSFTAPLVFVKDLTDTLTGRAGQVNNPRPLRYYDPVQVNDQGVVSNWLIRNCNPAYQHDDIQMAHYELQSLPIV